MSNNYTTAQASAGYTGIFSPSGELSEAETAARLNELEEQQHAGREMMARMLQQIEALRAALATGHERIGQAIALLNQGHTDAALSVLYDALRREAE